MLLELSQNERAHDDEPTPGAMVLVMARRRLPGRTERFQGLALRTLAREHWGHAITLRDGRLALATPVFAGIVSAPSSLLPLGTVVRFEAQHVFGRWAA